MRSSDTTDRSFTEGRDVLALMIFSLGGQFFACHSSEIRELLPVQPITSVPGAPEHFLGVIDVRGGIESIIDLHHLLKLEKDRGSSRQRIMIARHGNLVSGLLVDSVEDILNISQEEVKEVMFTLNESVGALATGQIRYRSGYAILLDMGKIFSLAGGAA
ncbi:MAG: purine-binding chemotaxis protein CheW [Magnetococcales bacterium]|nr:purine-binding chemotaxis protein CheW [Magnetococcales bacterium]